MGFEQLDTPAGVSALNEYLATRSYIEGFQPSAADVVVLEALKGKPEGDHALRWYNHISALKSKGASFPGEKKALSAYGGDFKVSASTAASAAKKEEKDEDDIDLFGSDDEVDEEAEKLKQQRLAEYAAKKAAKPAVVAKSQVILDIKPWDDETNMTEMEELVRGITMEGLIMGASKLVPVGFGIKKLQLATVIEDALVSVDELIEKICEFEDHVQSVDVAAFNKL